MKKTKPFILDAVVVSAPILLLVVLLGDVEKQCNGRLWGSVAMIYWIVAATLNLILAIIRRIRKNSRPSFAFCCGSFLNLAVFFLLLCNLLAPFFSVLFKS